MAPLVDSYTARVQHENRLLAALNTIAFWSHLDDDVSSFVFWHTMDHVIPNPTPFFVTKGLRSFGFLGSDLGFSGCAKKNGCFGGRRRLVDLKVWRGYDPVGERHVATAF